MRSKRPRLEDLYMPKVIRDFTGEGWQKTEHILNTATHPMIGVLSHNAHLEHGIAGMLRTAVLFVVEYDELAAIIDERSVHGVSLELPPLPFSRIAIEAEGDFGLPLLFSDEPSREVAVDANLIIDLVLMGIIPCRERTSVPCGTHGKQTQAVVA